MDGPDLATLVGIGELFQVAKLFMVAVHCLWMYDYLLTLGDEIKYAWAGRKSWVFVLFIGNRYTPVVHLIWIHTVMFHYNKSATKWIVIFHTTTVTVCAQTTVALRIYAVTKGNKLLTGALCVLIAAQLCFGVFSLIRAVMGSSVPVPDINIDAFRVCFLGRWRLGELLYINLAIAFDLLAFLIVVATVRKSKAGRYPGIPNILDAILRDATIYFMLIFACQLLFQLFLFLAPERIQLLPGVASAIFIPVMASRLMLSLKKAATKPTEPWSMTTMTRPSEGRSLQDEGLRFAPRVFSRSHETSEAPTYLGEGDIELESTPQNRESQQPC